jgi:hypothetical protein
VLGISSVDVALKTYESFAVSDDEDDSVVAAAKRFLDPKFRHAAAMTRFVVVLVMQLVMTAEVVIAL